MRQEEDLYKILIAKGLFIDPDEFELQQIHRNSSPEATVQYTRKQAIERVHRCTGRTTRRAISALKFADDGLDVCLVPILRAGNQPFLYRLMCDLADHLDIDKKHIRQVDPRDDRVCMAFYDHD